MSNYREIVTKAVIAKGKKAFTSTHSVSVDNRPSTILGCWIINHNFNGIKNGNTITINGSYDINIWYSYENDSKTDVVRQTNTYSEKVHMRDVESDVLSEEIIVRSLKQPNCVKVDIDNNKINYVVEKELGIELVGDVKMKIETTMEEDPWEEILEENKIDDVIDKEVKTEYIEEKI